MDEFQAFESRPNLWVLNEEVRDPWMGRGGRVRDNAGRALNGFFVRDYKKSRKVSVVYNGYYSRHYRFPHEPAAPRHPMVRWENVPMCGMPVIDPDGHSLSDDRAIERAVFSGKKPVGDVMFYHKDVDEKIALISKANAQGFEVIEYTRPHNADQLSFVMFGANRPLGELFNLKEIAAFYADGAGMSRSSLAAWLNQFSKLTPASALQTYDWASPEYIDQLILTGLCLGYAFESTLAIILEHAT
jgi:hypothetical protein